MTTQAIAIDRSRALWQPIPRSGISVTGLRHAVGYLVAVALLVLGLWGMVAAGDFSDPSQPLPTAAPGLGL